MPDPSRKPPTVDTSRRRILCAIIALAVVARVGSALYQGREVQPLPGVADQISYHELALRVLDGHGFSFDTGWWPATPANHPTAHWSCLYVLFLAAVYYPFGPSPLATRLIQAVLTVLWQPLLVGRIGRRLFGPRVGLVSAGLTALYAYFVFYAGALMTESFHMLALLWALDISAALADSSSPDGSAMQLKPWAELGIALVLACLLRQVMLLLVPVILAWVAWQVSGRPRPANESSGTLMLSVAGRVVLTVVLLSACILPWTIRNYRAFGQFVLLNTNAGFAFFWGNHPIHGTEFIPILPQDGPGYGALIPDELRGLNEAELDRALLRRGLAFAVEDPVRYIRLSVSRAKEYFKFWPSEDSSELSNYARVLSFGLCSPFFLSGLLLALLSLPRRRAGDRQHDSSGVKLLMLVAVLYSLLHLLSWTLVRYRLPVDAVTMPFAALSMLFFYDQAARAFRVVETCLRRPAG